MIKLYSFITPFKKALCKENGIKLNALGGVNTDKRKTPATIIPIE